MGLDMFLARRYRIYKDFNPLAYQAISSALNNPSFCDFGGILVDLPVYYWRKANAIHGWFVRNVQNGNDDCGTYVVSNAQLRDLLETCKRALSAAKTTPGPVKTCTTCHPGGRITEEYRPGEVITNPEEVAEILPVTDGSFFGSLDYNSHYLTPLRETINGLTKILEADSLPHTDYVYHSSW